MTSLAVPKHRVGVAVTLLGGVRREVNLFLAEAVPARAGVERVIDLLNAGNDFIPALEAESGAITFLNRTAIVLAEVPDDEQSEAEKWTTPTQHEVELTLSDGSVLRGRTIYVLPPDRNRLTDHLNDGHLFLSLRVQQRVLLVNKRHLVRVVPAA